MKKILLLSALAGGIATGAQAQQLPNGNFDDAWVDCIPYIGANQTAKTQSIQPKGWIISNVNGYKGLGATIVGKQSNENEGFAVTLENTPNPFMPSQIVPAYISLGTTWNTSKGMFTITNKDGGSFGGIQFTYRPDAIQFRYKRTAADPKIPATVIAYMWKGEWQQADVPVSIELNGEPTKETMINRDRSVLGLKYTEGGTVTKSKDALCIAKLEEKLSEVTEAWKEMTIPFTYDDLNAVPTQLNVIFAANDYFDATTVKQGNTLSIDDVKFVYYSQLSALSINGNPIENFDKNTYTYEVNGDYTEGCITATSDGKGASVSTTYDEASRTATITVEGEDININSGNKHVYTVKFIEVVKPDYTENLVITINGNSEEPIKQGLFMKEVTPGFYNLSIKDFALINPNTPILIGDIVLENVPAKNVNGQLQYEKYQETIITSENPDALGPKLGKLPISFKGRTINGRLWASLQIDMRSTLGQMIIVTIGDSPTVKGKDVTGVNHNNVVCLNYRMGYQANITEMDKSVTKADLEEVAATQLENCIVYNPSIAGKNVVNTTNNSCELYTLSEKKDGLAIPASFTATAINYDREFTTTANYISSFVLPYSMNVSDVQGEVYEFASVEANTINFKKATMVEANKPYLIVATAANPFKATNVKVEATPAAMETVNGDYAHVGTYTKQEVISDATTTYYGYANGQFVKANTGTLNPFRTMIKATNTAAPATLSLKLDGEVTGIVGVNSELGKVNVYNLEGKLVRSQVAAATALQGLAKGVYVINGKKVVK